MNTTETIKEIQKDIKNLKLKSFQPDKNAAKVFLDFFSWEEGSAKQNFKALYSKDLQLLNEWIEIYCEEYGCKKEEALARIIDGVL